jgi:hypothetical protein
MTVRSIAACWKVLSSCRFSGGFHSHLKCLKRFIVLLPGAALRVAEDLRMRAGLSLSHDAASRREYGSQMVHISTRGPRASPCRRRRSSRMICRSLLMVLYVPWFLVEIAVEKNL